MSTHTDPNDSSNSGAPISGQQSDESHICSFDETARPPSPATTIPSVDNRRDRFLTVLVVDDEKKTADANTLRIQERYDVRTAYGGREALEVFDESVDVVLLDRRMPFSGDKVLKELRERDADCRVIMVTAVNPDFSIVDMPFDDYLCKPIDSEELLSAIDNQARIIAYERFSEYFRLTAKRAVLETELKRYALEENEEYIELESRTKTLRAALTGLLDDFDHLSRAFDRIQLDTAVALADAAK